MFPEVPTDLTGLGITELRALSDQIRETAEKNLLDPALTTEDQAATMAALADRKRVITRRNELKAAAKAAKELADETDEDEDETDAGDGGDAGGDAGDADAGTEAGAAAKTVKLATTTGTELSSGGAATKTLPQLTALDGVSGKTAGEAFTSWGDMVAALTERADTINAATSERFPVARIKANYPESRKFSDNTALNLAKFDHEEMVAALCAPATPVYDIHCMNAIRRPVFNKLPGYEAPRMKVSVMPSPKLSDILPNTGVGQWTAANEASTTATKNPCATITCGSPTEYQVYGIYRCITIRNMLAMSYPELVEGWLNRLQAAQSRMAEIALLNAMGTAATAINGISLGYGAATTITTTLMNYLALYQETQRWDVDRLQIWGHRWIREAMKVDLARRRNTAGTIQKIVTDAEIDQMFSDAGFDVTWFIDTPTWSATVPPVATASTLNRFPVDATFLINQPGKFGLMDRGNLNIGVTGNNIYRDNNSNNRNEFTMFWESFEGVVDTGMCDAHLLTIPQLCYNGVQQDDAFMNCQGLDEPGYQS